MKTNVQKCAICNNVLIGAWYMDGNRGICFPCQHRKEVEDATVTERTCGACKHIINGPGVICGPNDFVCLKCFAGKNCGQDSYLEIFVKPLDPPPAHVGQLKPYLVGCFTPVAY